MRIKEEAVTALYAALSPSAVKPHADVADIEADARFTQAVAAEWALRFQLARNAGVSA
jgi:hypothetical protein